MPFVKPTKLPRRPRPPCGAEIWRNRRARSLLPSLLVLVVLLAHLRAATALAGEEEKMDPRKFAVIVGRLLSYDNAIKSRSGESIDIAILFNPASPASQAEAKVLEQAMAPLAQVRIAGLSTRIRGLPFVDGASLEKATAQGGLDVFVLCSGLEGKTTEIKNVTNNRHVLSVARSSVEVMAGMAIGVFIEEGKSTILVNLGASKAEGAILASDLLRLAKVLR